MKIKVSISGRGAETAIGSVPSKVYNFIQKKFDGDLDDYTEAVGDGSVPSQYVFGYGYMSGYAECGDLHHSYAPFIGSCYVTVKDEKGKVLLDGVDGEDLSNSDSDRSVDVELKKGEHCVFFQSEEKGDWSENEIEIKGKFSKEKLRLLWTGMKAWDADGEEIGESFFVSGIEYDGVEYELNLDDILTDGKSLMVELH